MASRGSSYWSIRRRIRRDLAEHFSDIENLNRPVVENSLDNLLQIQTSNTATQLSCVEIKIKSKGLIPILSVQTQESFMSMNMTEKPTFMMILNITLIMLLIPLRRNPNLINQIVNL